MAWCVIVCLYTLDIITKGAAIAYMILGIMYG